MKSAILFVSGALMGALLVWAVFCQEVVVLGNGQLVRVNRFTGEARFLFISGLEMEARQKAEEALAAAAEKSTPPAAPGHEWRELTAEESAQLQLTWWENGSNSVVLSFHNVFEKQVLIKRVRVQVPAYEGRAALDRLYELQNYTCPPLADETCIMKTEKIDWHRLRTPHPGQANEAVTTATITPVLVMTEK